MSVAPVLRAFDKAAHLMIRFVERPQEFVAPILLERAQRRHAREFGGVRVGLVDESDRRANGLR